MKIKIFEYISDDEGCMERVLDVKPEDVVHQTLHTIMVKEPSYKYGKECVWVMTYFTDKDECIRRAIARKQI
jgi:hypothetical protein